MAAVGVRVVVLLLNGVEAVVLVLGWHWSRRENSRKSLWSN
jgi:hypothetical protein